MARITKRQTLAQRSKFEELFELFAGNRLFLMEGRFVGTDWEYNHKFTENYWLVSRIEAIQEIKSKEV